MEGRIEEEEDEGEEEEGGVHTRGWREVGMRRKGDAKGVKRVKLERERD